MERTFAQIEFRGNTVYVYDGRITQEEDDMLTAEGFHVYGIRHDDEDSGLPATVEPIVICNFYGLMITQTALEFPERYSPQGKLDEYIEFTEEESDAIISAAGFLNNEKPYTLDEITGIESWTPRE